MIQLQGEKILNKFRTVVSEVAKLAKEILKKENKNKYPDNLTVKA